MGMMGANGDGKPASFRELWGAALNAGAISKVDVPPEGQIYVSSLPADTTDLDLFKLFSQFGAIKPSGVKAMLNEDGTCKGFGFVDFLDPMSAQTAVASMNGLTTMSGGTIQCKIKIQKDKSATPGGATKG